MHTIIDHPLVQHKLSYLRDSATGTQRFGELACEITRYLAYEALKNLDTKEVAVQTPMAVAKCRRVSNKVVLVPILRAGVGMIDGMKSMMPDVSVGFLGMYRDHETAEPVEYYAKLPVPDETTVAMVIDPMLATGGSATAALNLLKNRGFKKIIFVCIVSCRYGVDALEKSHPDVPIYAAAMDEELNSVKYIVPGLGDAGDRLFGTL